MRRMAAVVSIRAEKVDRLGKLAKLIEPIRPALKEYEDLRKEIVAWFEDQPADKVCIESGKLYEVEASEKGEERTINIAKLAKKLGPKRFLAVVTVPMKLLDQHVSPEDQKDMVTSARTGSRRVKVRLRMQPKGKDAA